MSVKRNIIFEDGAWDFIGRISTELGVSASDYVRTASLARAMYDYAKLFPEEVVAWGELYRLAAMIQWPPTDFSAEDAGG